MAGEQKTVCMYELYHYFGNVLVTILVKNEIANTSQNLNYLKQLECINIE